MLRIQFGTSCKLEELARRGNTTLEGYAQRRLDRWQQELGRKAAPTARLPP